MKTLPLLRTVFIIFLTTLGVHAATTTTAKPAPTTAPSTNVSKPAPATPPPIPAPAFLDVVTFQVHLDSENRKLVVTTGPSLLRVDEPDERYSLLYNPQTDHYTGLEHGNYTYWEFSWPEVRDAIQTSKRYETHLQDLNNQGLGADFLNSSAGGNTNSAPVTSSAGTDNSGYVWRPTNDKKRIAGLDCVRWTGDTVSGDPVEVWCAATPQPKIQAAINQLRIVNEPMALVPIRTLVPSFVFPIYDGLAKGGVTPVLIIWGGGQDKNRFAFVKAETRDGNLGLFNIPKLYTRTTLITLDGIIDQKK